MNRERRFVSILGDSISTFEGFHPEGYRVFMTKTGQFNTI